MAEGRLSSSPLFSKSDDEGPMAEGLEALLRSAQAALSASSATLPSAEERRAEAAMAECPSRWRPLEQGLWRRPLSEWQGGSGGSGCAG